MTIDSLIKKYEDKIKEYGDKPCYHAQSAMECDIYYGLLQDLNVLRDKIINYQTSNLPLHKDTAFFSGIIQIPVDELIGKE